MNRSALVLGVSMAASLVAFLVERDASACGGCFHPPTQTVSDITDERMLLSVSPTQTTLYDQIRYAGSPASFAWVLPIRATVTVGLSADVLFDSFDELTATQISPPNVSCPGPPSGCSGGGCGSSSNAAFALAPGEDVNGTVTVTKQQNVGPYDTVQLHATDASALNGWLAQNGFSIPADVTPVIDAYVSEGFDFLAMKLLPDQGVQAMRPVRVSMPGASFSLPLRMAAVGTGVTVGITIWVVSEGRYEPQNFPFFHIDDSQLVWDFEANASNYATLRDTNEKALGGRGWEIESSIDLNEQLISDVITAGGVYSGNGFAPAPASDATEDYLPVGPADAGDGDAAPQLTETADQVRQADLAALFAGMSATSVRVTRIRSDVAHSAMTSDLILRASADQAELSNVRTVTQSVGLSCPIYDNCSIVGYGTPDQAQASVDGHRGCVASARSQREPGAPLAALGGGLALVAARFIRARRRRRSPPRAR
jgi:hypothetical protein